MRTQSGLTLFRKSLRETFYQYVDNTKVNGLWMLRRKPNSTNHDELKRFCWSVILFSLLILGVFLSIMLWNKFYSLPTIVSIENHVPVTNVAFPGVTLCSPLAILEYKLDAFMERIINKLNYSSNDIKIALRSLEGFTSRHTINETRYNMVDEILEENNLTVFETMSLLGGSCEDFLQYCYWGSKQFPCYQKNDDLTFTTSISHVGYCCSFNYRPEDQSYIPFSANNFGVNGGLVIVGLDRIMGNQSTGLLMKVHHPLDYVVEAHTLITLNPYHETFVVVYPVELSSSKEVLELSATKRNCRISSDYKRSKRYYRQAGCILNCHHQLVYRTCGCHPFHYPAIYRKKGIRNCSAKDISCFIRNFDYFKSVKCKECLPNCYDVTYSTSTDYTDLMQHNISASVIYSAHNLSQHSFIVRVYLANQVVTSHKKIIIMSVVSLLADLGGVFNLCLGISAISIVEFFYFFTYRLYVNYRSQTAIIYVKEKKQYL